MTSPGGQLRIGLIGSALTAICCFTPILVVLFGAVGLSWAIGYLDFVLIPALLAFLLLTGFAVWRMRRTP